MAGRNRVRELPLTRAHNTSPINDPRHHRVTISSSGDSARDGATTARPHLALIEERIALQHREIQTLLFDNQRLVATHVALKQELAVAQHDLRHLSAAAAEVKGERDAQVREVYERSMKMEAEVRSIEAMNAELAHVRADTQKLSNAKQELTTELQTIDNDLARARSDLQQLPAVNAEIESMHQELQRGRAAVEYEKKTRASNLEHSQAMEKNMVIMAREIEKLRAELANVEKRARAAAAAANPSPGYAASYGNPDMGYGGNPYMDPHAIAMHQVHGSTGVVPQYGFGAFQVHGSTGVVPQYGFGAVPNGPYGMQQPNVQ